MKRKPSPSPMPPPRALICGVSGQDGSLLGRFLLEKGYQVFGTSRDARTCPFANLHRLKVAGRIEKLSMSLNDFKSVLRVLDHVQPDEVYNLAGQTSVGLSFKEPVATFESIAIGTLNLLEAIRLGERPVRFFHAGSSECFGDTGETPADEETPFHPASPYGVAKAAAIWSVANYRKAYGLHACSGILFNHESPLRPEWFVTRKVVAAACRIASGSREKLRLGNLDIQRDWGWAPKHVESMWQMLQLESPQDLVIATGQAYSLRDFVAAAFAEVDLDWKKHTAQDPSLFRPVDIHTSVGNPARARNQIGWAHEYSMPEVIQKMIAAERGEVWS